jgi:hypothetical protein
MADFLGVLVPDEDSMPCVRREWHLAEFDEELVDLCARAWLRIGETIIPCISCIMAFAFHSAAALFAIGSAPPGAVTALEQYPNWVNRFGIPESAEF